MSEITPQQLVEQLKKNAEEFAKNPPPKKEPPPPPKPRLTVVDKVYFQSPAQAAQCVESAFSIDVGNDEQPYIRRVTKIGKQWLQLDQGWLADQHLGMMIIRNDSIGKDPNPARMTPEEKWAFTIELALLIKAPIEMNRDMHSPPKQQDKILPFAEIPPGQSARFKPLLGTLLMMQSCGMMADQQAVVTLSFFPA